MLGVACSVAVPQSPPHSPGKEAAGIMVVPDGKILVAVQTLLRVPHGEGPPDGYSTV
jgi:hypothetical protein